MVGQIHEFRDTPSGMNVSIYNHQPCVLDKRLWPFARKSISDWKNEYMPECMGCREKDNCGGFFFLGETPL